MGPTYIRLGGGWLCLPLGLDWGDVCGFGPGTLGAITGFIVQRCLQQGYVGGLLFGCALPEAIASLS